MILFFTEVACSLCLHCFLDLCKSTFFCTCAYSKNLSLGKLAFWPLCKCVCASAVYLVLYLSSPWNPQGHLPLTLSFTAFSWFSDYRLANTFKADVEESKIYLNVITFFLTWRGPIYNFLAVAVLSKKMSSLARTLESSQVTQPAHAQSSPNSTGHVLCVTHTHTHTLLLFESWETRF